jgi:AmmeMemoRadiSam system protein A
MLSAPHTMNEAQKRELLHLARDTVYAVVAGRSLPTPQSEDPDLTATCGCFVTLKNGGRLRGCIGQFTSDKPLVGLVVEMAKASATSDPRFLSDPIVRSELNELDVEISVLSPLKKTDNPLSLTLGTDGIYIKQGCASGCFLPQVATETGWSKEEFLSYCCSHKAGLPADAWKDPQTEVFLFTADVFGAALKEL